MIHAAVRMQGTFNNDDALSSHTCASARNPSESLDNAINSKPVNNVDNHSTEQHTHYHNFRPCRKVSEERALDMLVVGEDRHRKNWCENRFVDSVGRELSWRNGVKQEGGRQCDGV